MNEWMNEWMTQSISLKYCISITSFLGPNTSTALRPRHVEHLASCGGTSDDALERPKRKPTWPWCAHHRIRQRCLGPISQTGYQPDREGPALSGPLCDGEAPSQIRPCQGQCHRDDWRTRMALTTRKKTVCNSYHALQVPAWPVRDIHQLCPSTSTDAIQMHTLTPASHTTVQPTVLPELFCPSRCPSLE